MKAPGKLEAIFVLVLLASVVTGAEQTGTPLPVPTDELDVQRLERARKEPQVQEIFAARSWAPPAPAPAPIALAKPEPPPVPSAPPLPFRYLGRLVDGENAIVFLERNQQVFSAAAGQRVEDLYQLESVSDSTLQFVYLPLGTRQTLAIPAP